MKEILSKIWDNARMDRWLAMEAFVRIVESGSFVGAAERLRLSTSSLSRLVADLEQHLGARLLNRTTRRLSLTESGQSYYERCVTLLADLAEAEAVAGLAAAEPRGTIRLTCSYSMANSGSLRHRRLRRSARAGEVRTHRL